VAGKRADRPCSTACTPTLRPVPALLLASEARPSRLLEAKQTLHRGKLGLPYHRKSVHRLLPARFNRSERCLGKRSF
jgi:hypothetical protein